jgi:beta-glucanase (GH16 family)
MTPDLSNRPQRHFIRHALVLILLASGVTHPTLGDDDPPATINPETMRLVFNDEFDALDVARRRKPGSTWTAGLPYNGDFGGAAFVPTPRDGFPFRIEDGVLVIEANRRWDRKWESGLLSSIDRDYEGFAQQFGYFEARMKLPSGRGVWPAFWLLGKNRNKDDFTAEIDILEFHGARPGSFESHTHVWNWDPSKEHQHQSKTQPVAVGTLSKEFNTFGALITPDATAFYFNRSEIARFPTPHEFHQPMWLLLNLALDPEADKTALKMPQRMHIDYVRVYAWPGGDMDVN